MRQKYPQARLTICADDCPVSVEKVHAAASQL